MTYYLPKALPPNSITFGEGSGFQHMNLGGDTIQPYKNPQLVVYLNGMGMTIALRDSF